MLIILKAILSLGEECCLVKSVGKKRNLGILVGSGFLDYEVTPGLSPSEYMFLLAATLSLEQKNSLGPKAQSNYGHRYVLFLATLVDS